MIEPHMQAMATALLYTSIDFENVAAVCRENGHEVSAKVIYDIVDRLDNVWQKYDEDFQAYKQQFLHTIECDDE